MYKTTARAVTAVHDLFVFAALLFTVASFFLRGSRPYSEMPTAWVVPTALSPATWICVPI